MKDPAVVDVRSQHEYTLRITFDNEETGLLDMNPYLDFGIFSRIKDPHSFAKVRVSFDTVEWESGADLDPEFVYRKCKKNTPESLDIITHLNQPKNMPELNFTKSKDGLLPAIAQDAASGDVLMLAYINEESWQKTLETGKAHYWSRSRNKLWLKGESSGHVQLIKEILVDCDEDTVVFKVEQLGGAACHKGYASCFFRRIHGDELEIIAEPVFDPAKVYG